MDLDNDWMDLLNPLMMIPSMNLNIVPDPNAFVSATDLFGPMEAHSACSDRKQLRKLMLQSGLIGSKVLDMCGILDRQKLLEACSLLQERNKVHVSYIHYITSSWNHLNGWKPKRRPASQAARHETLFRAAIKDIKSLETAGLLIDEFFDLFYALEDTAVDSGVVRREDLLFKLIHLSSSLGEMCTTVEDRTKFMIASEIGREQTREQLNELFQGVASLNLQ
ncbi:hypothetical protein HDU98_012111 [Podochytrium sp. JEL0797]|nr:hypothetical protein HDU98_012111 [Podochytrium sp. JEL0797]